MANLDITVIPAEEYAQAAKKWRKELLQMPVLAMGDALKFLTALPGVRTNQYLGGINTNAQFYPYAANKRGEAATAITFEELEVFFGTMNEDFIPNDYVQTLLGEGAIVLGDGMKNSDIAKLVIASILKQAGENLVLALFNATRNSSGNTTADLFNGFATKIAAAKTAGKISAEKGNYKALSAEPTAATIVDVIKDIEFNLDPRLRRQERFLYCDPHILDLYNEGYLFTHPSVVYNDKYEQVYVEGSNRRMTFAPMDGLAGTNLMIVAPKINMVVGYDNISDLEKLEVLRTDVDTLTLAAKMFFGVGFRTYDKRFLKVIEVVESPAPEPEPEPEKVATPSFSPVAGSYDEAQSVVIACETAGASIYYTTDGTTPTAESTAYSEAIAVSATTTVKAIAVKDGMTNSDVASATYTIS